VSDNDLSPLADTEVHYLRSEHVGDQFKIFIGHCGESRTAPPAVLYVHRCQRPVRRRRGHDPGSCSSRPISPSVLVVGIGYPGRFSHRDHRATAPATSRPRYDSDPRRRAFRPIGDGRCRPLSWPSSVTSCDRGCRTDSASTLPIPPISATLWGACSEHTCSSPSPPPSGDTASGVRRCWWHEEIIFEHEDTVRGGPRRPPGQGVLLDRGIRETTTAASESQKGCRPMNGPRHHSATSTWWRTPSDWLASLRTREYPNLEMASCGPPREFHITVPLMNLSRRCGISSTRRLEQGSTTRSVCPRRWASPSDALPIAECDARRVVQCELEFGGEVFVALAPPAHCRPTATNSTAWVSSEFTGRSWSWTSTTPSAWSSAAFALHHLHRFLTRRVQRRGLIGQLNIVPGQTERLRGDRAANPTTETPMAMPTGW